MPATISRPSATGRLPRPGPLRLIWRQRALLWPTTRADLRTRVAGSALGPGWLVLVPALLLTAYSSVFVFVFRVRLGELQTPEYVLLILSGLVPFLSFAEALASGTPSVSGNATL